MHEYRIGKLRYMSMECLTIGDYGGSGTVGEANQRAIDAAVAAGECSIEDVDDHYKMDEATRANPDDPTEAWQWPRYLRGSLEWVPEPMPTADVLIATGAYGYREYLIRSDDDAPQWCHDIIAALDSYPLLDEEEHSYVESEWEEEATPDMLWELRRMLSEDGDPSERDLYDDVDPDDAATALRDAMDQCNVYWYHENASACISSSDLRRVFPAWRSNIFPHLAEE